MNIEGVRASVAAELEKIVREIGKIPPADTSFTQHSELFDSGYLDSLGIVSLATYIEETFGVTLSEENLFDARFTTIAGIAGIIASGIPDATSAEG
jgi:acyl carrier protein